MGELRGPGDQPPNEPDKSTNADQVGSPDPSWNTTKDGSKIWRVIRSADDRFAMPGESRSDRSRLEYEKPRADDRPAERPPSGEELAETDGPSPSLLDKARKKAADKEFMDDLFDVADKGGKAGGDLVLGPVGSAKAEVCVPNPVHWEKTPHQLPDGGQVLTGMLVVGLMIGHGTMRAHHMWSERKHEA